MEPLPKISPEELAESPTILHSGPSGITVAGKALIETMQIDTTSEESNARDMQRVMLLSMGIGLKHMIKLPK